MSDERIITAATVTSGEKGDGQQLPELIKKTEDDPLNQRASVGWKGMRAAERLVEQYMIRIESVSSYSASASAN